MGKVFELKPIKRGVKSHFNSSKHSLKLSKANIFSNFQQQQLYYCSASLNPYISRQLNNMDQAQVMKREREDWSRLYHKILKGIETIIDVQRMVKNMKKMAEEANTTIIEVEETILMASINNWTTNTMNITQISEDL